MSFLCLERRRAGGNKLTVLREPLRVSFYLMIGTLHRWLDEAGVERAAEVGVVAPWFARLF